MALISLIDDLKFTFGKCIENKEVAISESIDIGKVHDISFEFVHNNLSNDLNAHILKNIVIISNTSGTVSTLYYTEGSSTVAWTNPLPADTDIHKIKFSRNHINVSLYIDDVLISTKQLTSNNEFEFDEFLSLGEYGRIGNIKIISGDKILHWWKLNSIINDEFYDEGLNDIDFYTYWYSVSYLFAILIKYDETFFDLENNIEVIRKYIESKGIYINSDITNVDLIYIYQNWIEEFEKRGTEQMYLPKQETILGRCVQTYDDTGNVFEDISFYDSTTGYNLGKELEFEFKWKPTDDFVGTGGNPASILGEFDIQNPSASLFQFTYYHDVNARWSSIALDKNTTYIIKIIRSQTKVWLYIDGVNQGEKPYAANSDHGIGAGYTYTTIVEGGLFGRVSNIRVKWGTESLYWPMIESDGVNCLEISKDLVNDLKINIIADPDLASDILENIRIIDDDFNNIITTPIDGEILRLLGYESSDEFIIGKIRNPELGWYLGVSSPGSHQTFPIINLNKSYDKQPNVENHFNYPEIPGSLERVIFDDKTCFKVDVISSSSTSVYLADMQSKVLSSRSAFTNQYGLRSNQVVNLFRELNIGIDYTVEFEIYVNTNTFGLVNNWIIAHPSYGANNLGIKISSNSAIPTVYNVYHLGANFIGYGTVGAMERVKLIRKNSGADVDLYIDDVYQATDSVILSTTEYAFSRLMVLETNNIIDISNIEIYQDSIKTHWWKCNEIIETKTSGDNQALLDSGYHSTLVAEGQIGIHSDFIDKYSYTNSNIYIPVDNALSYEVSFMLYFPDDTLVSPIFVDFGITPYDVDFIEMVDAFDGVGSSFASNSFVKYWISEGLVSTYLAAAGKRFDIRPEFQIGVKGSWVFYRGIVYGADVDGIDREDELNLGFGENLRFEDDVKYIVPNIRLLSSSEVNGYTNTYYLHNINIRPLKLPIGKGYLNTRNVFINYLKNNDRFSETEINSIFGNKMFPYNSFIKNKYI